MPQVWHPTSKSLTQQNKTEDGQGVNKITILRCILIQANIAL